MNVGGLHRKMHIHSTNHFFNDVSMIRVTVNTVNGEDDEEDSGFRHKG